MACPYSPEARALSSAVQQAESGASSNLTYQTYLQIPRLLSCQQLESAKFGEPAHDELLFITVHQVYELWFQQILHELDSIRAIFMKGAFAESQMLRIVSRLTRVNEILKICVQQIHVLETMTPLDFESFRKFLSTSSGFQSVQFRLLENKLGIKRSDRIRYNQHDYCDAMSDSDREVVVTAEQEPSLLQLVQQWLERTPGVATDFWANLERNIMRDLATRRAVFEENGSEGALEEINGQEATFQSLFNLAAHNELVAAGQRRLSYEATIGAVIISFHRDEPLFHLPFKTLECLQNLDQQLMEWRHNHAMLVQRMIGSKVGTGGSSGYQYLRSTVSDRYKVFVDLNNLSTYIVPRPLIPPLNVETQHRQPTNDA